MNEDRQQLIEKSMSLVEKLARKIGKGYNDVEDLVGYAYEELVKFAVKWNPETEIPFEAYLLTYLKPRLLRYKRIHTTVVSIPQRYDGNDISVCSLEGNHWLEEVEGDMDLAEIVCEKHFKTVGLSEAIKKLTKRERIVIDMLYKNDISANDVALNLNIGKSAVSQLKKNALAKLRRELAA